MTDPLQVQFGGTDLVIDVDGPDPLVVQFADALHVIVPDEPLVLMFVAAGLPGRDGADGLAGAGAPIEAVAAQTMPQGTPVAIDRTTGQLVPADAAFKPLAFVAGLLADAAAAGFVASAAVERLTLADWSAIAGVSSLVPGLPYFLAAGGGLTPEPPASDCVAMVGKALDTATLLIDPQVPIQR